MGTHNYPKVSVIIPNYNYARFLENRINSILNQSFQDFEIIILDDCSTDDSKEVIERYRNNPHVSNIVYSEKNSGSPFIQWEHGCSLAKGEWIWIAESDDMAEANFLEVLINRTDKEPNAVVAYSHSFMIDSDGNTLDMDWHNGINYNKTYYYRGKSFIHKKLSWNNCIYNASMAIFRRSAFLSINNAYMQYKSCGDWMFWTEICSKGDVIEVCLRLNCFRQHPKRTTKKAFYSGQDWKEAASILSHIESTEGLSEWRLHVFRGKWTKNFAQSRYPNKDELVSAYPQLFDGNSFDLACYKIMRLYYYIKIRYTHIMHRYSKKQSNYLEA